jgi:hypothetical protein
MGQSLATLKVAARNATFTKSCKVTSAVMQQIRVMGPEMMHREGHVVTWDVLPNSTSRKSLQGEVRQAQTRTFNKITALCSGETSRSNWAWWCPP